jgi:DNA-binding CsgD family transcriptional regulator
MHKLFQSFVDGVSDGADGNSLHAALADVAEGFGFPLFAYFSIPSGLRTAAWLISNYSSEWTDRYLHNQYDRLDPVIVHASNAVDPFLWGEGIPEATQAADHLAFFEEASAFGIRRGLTIPIHEQRAQVAAVTFATDERAPLFDRSIELHSRILQLMAFYFHRHARRLLSEDRVVDGVKLSKRELECLEWAARGKSASDIGTILGISRKTAAFHLDNARAKLDVRSIQQAVALLGESRSRR